MSAIIEAEQLSFLDSIEPDETTADTEQIKVTIIQLQPNLWQALIDGGWWTAMAATQQKAIDRVVAMRDKELEKLGIGEVTQ